MSSLNHRMAKQMRYPNRRKGQLEPGLWYELDPPAEAGGNLFSVVRCEASVCDKRDEYFVRGIPNEGETEEELILDLTHYPRDCKPTDPA